MRSVASQIPAASAAGVAPVAVIERAEIERSGRKNVYDLLRGLTNPNNLGLNRPTVVGTDNAVYLVNGRRVPSPASFYVLESLPISAVERVEILADSAAALHGGEAIGGAINIVLRRNIQGVEAQASVEHPTDPGGESGHASALWGGALGDGHVVVGADVYHRGKVRSADRDFSRSAWTPGGSFIGTVGVTEDGNTVYVPTVSLDENGNPVVHIADAEGLSIARALGDCQGGSYTGVLRAPGGTDGAGCGYAVADSQWQRSRFQRQSVFAGLDQPLPPAADPSAGGPAPHRGGGGRRAP
ncbi:MAG: TonB-dependent receptor plug domain-containing protein, partial [Thiotrichales bacterium]|nr:TonB-dependent receptor plug domain-containing protein [Thiotrichales bacterium]